MLNLFNRQKGKVKYVVKGKPGSFDVTYTCGDETHQVPEVKSGWVHTFPCPQNDYYFVAAQANKKDAAVKIKVYRDGKLLKEANNYGDYAIVVASSTKNP
ncbi:MAG: hypothetical protein R6T99_03070 [Bacteroidales bacterium]